jgi:hypothetical protein
MKKLVFSIAALGLVSLTSCKKEFTCACTTTANGTSTTVEAKTAKVSKKDAKTACEKESSLAGVTVKCVIK